MYLYTKNNLKNTYLLIFFPLLKEFKKPTQTPKLSRNKIHKNLIRTKRPHKAGYPGMELSAGSWLGLVPGSSSKKEARESPGTKVILAFRASTSSIDKFLDWKRLIALS